MHALESHGRRARSIGLAARLLLTALAALLAATVAILATATTAASLGRTQGSLVGVVFDSLLWRPLGGAVVQLATEPGVEPRHTYVTHADGEGRYRITGVEPGRYVAAFYHPFLDTLGIEAPIRRADVRANDETTLALATPSAQRMIRAICPAKMMSDSSSLLVGHVRDARTLGAVAGATISLDWFELLLSRKGARRERPTLAVATDDGGWFALCNPPTGIDLRARASSGADSSGWMLLAIPPRSVAWRELYVGPSIAVPGDTLVVADSANPTRVVLALRRGEVQLHGDVRSSNGRPIAGAAISVWGTRARTTSDDSGRFVLHELPGGTYALQVRAIGYLPATIPVDLTLARAPSAEVTMLGVKQFLDTVRVTTTPLLAATAGGFEKRRQTGTGFGRFFSHDEILAKAPVELADIFNGIPSMRVTPSETGPVILMRGLYGRPLQDTMDRGPGLECAPNIYVDGVLGNMLSFAFAGRPEEIAGMEIYTNAAQVPAEFHTGNGCGVIVIWTTHSFAPQKRRTP